MNFDTNLHESSFLYCIVPCNMCCNLECVIHVLQAQESRMVSQFHFTRWTKATPPSEYRSMIDLIDELQRVQRKSGNMPITVHCE